VDLPGVFGTVAPFVTHYGYAAVLVVVLLENIGLIFPGEAVIVTAALFAGNGRLSLLGVAVAAFVGAAVGAGIGYGIGRFGGRALVLRLGRRAGITHHRLDRLERFFDRHGIKLVTAARFLPVLRHGNGIAAGTSLMSWHRFLVGNVIGAAIWVGFWTVVGHQGASHLDLINGVLHRAGPVALVLIGVGLVTLVVRRRARRRSSLVEPAPLPTD
jgi:membrane protein DedA with SNARE-associated domain